MRIKGQAVALVSFAAFAGLSISSSAQSLPNRLPEPTSILIYVDRLGQSEQFAHAMIFKRRDSFNIVSHFYPPDNQNRVIVENSFIVETATIDDVTTRNLLDQADVEALEQKRIKLAAIAKRCENAAPLLKPTLDLLSQYSKMLAGGNVFISNQWMTRSSYEEAVRAEAQIARERQMALEKLMEQRRTAAAEAIRAEQLAKQLARKKAEEALKSQLQTYITTVETLIHSPDAIFSSNLDSWGSLNTDIIQKSNELILKGEQLVKATEGGGGSVKKCLQDLMVLVASSEAAALWQSGDGESAANKFIKLVIPTTSDQSKEQIKCWTALHHIRQDLDKRIEESDKYMKKYYDALAQSKSVEAMRYLELALQFVPNPRIKTKLTDMKKNTLGL